MLDSIRVLGSGDSDELDRLVKTGDLHGIRDADNNTLLHHACMLGNVDTVRILLDSGLHANIGNVDGHTPICDAALNGSAEIISLLLERGADVNPLSYWGTPLLYATQNGHLSAMDVLIKGGAYLNATDRYGFCPLHEAVRREFHDGVDLLLQGGADPNSRARLTTPLHLAAELGDSYVACRLLAYGAFPSPVDSDGRTPLDLVPPSSPLYDIIKSFLGCVPSLQFLSRLAIRRGMKSLLPTHISQLGLPSLLCDYISLKYL